MKSLFPALIILFFLTGPVFAQGPEVTSWIINTSGATGYNNIPSNVQQVRYGVSNVYVTTTCIPSYTIGPWPGNPNTPTNQNFVFKITRSPVQNTGTPVGTSLGHIGVWSNGVSIYNALDAFSYNNQNVWHQNAQFWEGSSFDNCLGHPAPNGEYHHHVNPSCLYDDDDSLHHSPIIGYAFDGFPIYGAYGYDNPSIAGTIRRMRSSYRERNITTRVTLPDGSTASSAGPAVAGQYGISAYIEDFEYVSGLGDLDEHNGRFCITPDYPNGIYAYFVTIDDNQNPVYPYVIGLTYYGTIQSGNIGPGSGHNVPTESVTTYDPTVSVPEYSNPVFNVFPNPSTDKVIVKLSGSTTVLNGLLTDATGKLIRRFDTMIPGESYVVDVTELSPGFYFFYPENDPFVEPIKVIVSGNN